MGLSFRKRSGRIANGSRLVVPGQITTGSKVYQITFGKKQSAPDNKQPDIVPSQTPQPTPTPTPTPVVAVDAVIVGDNTYLSVGDNEYLMYVNN